VPAPAWRGRRADSGRAGSTGGCRSGGRSGRRQRGWRESLGLERTVGEPGVGPIGAVQPGEAVVQAGVEPALDGRGVMAKSAAMSG
jgi:hypothetical protein